MFQKIFVFLFLFLSTSLFASSTDLGFYSVNADVLKIRTGPSSKYKHSYSMYKQQETKVYELQDGWARISKSKTNAKWAYAKFLTKNTPKKSKPTIEKKPEPQAKEEPKIEVNEAPPKQEEKTKFVDRRLQRIISKSDGFKQHSKMFILVSQKLVSSQICKVTDFRKTRGWIEIYENELYFTYCGGFSRKNKIFLNLKTNELTGDLRKYK